MLIHLVHLRSHTLQYLGMLQKGVQHERADAGGRIHADKVGGENVRWQIRFRQELRIGPVHLQQLIHKVWWTALPPLRPMRFHYVFVKLLHAPLGAPVLR